MDRRDLLWYAPFWFLNFKKTTIKTFFSDIVSHEARDVPALIHDPETFMPKTPDKPRKRSRTHPVSLEKRIRSCFESLPNSERQIAELLL
ncbi:hypothetical protein V6O07_14405, partial [Arthrospira platensis SPKY2]